MNDQLIIGECKRGVSNLVRPHFTEGLLLQDDDLTTGVSYTRELSRLMFRTLFGCGVMCGLKVNDPTSGCEKLKIPVDKGLALNCIGDPVEVAKPQTIEIDESKFEGKAIWIGLRHYEKCCAPRNVVCSPDDEDTPSVCTRERDGYELCALSERPPCKGCGCEPVKPPSKDPGTQKKNAAAAAATGSSTGQAPKAEKEANCLCNTRTGKGDCYEAFYAGDCPGACCESEWILLAVITKDDEGKWTVDHSVRRFVRPVLMRDPLVTNA